MTKNSISTNIIRDVNHDLQYIPTPNSKRVFQRIVNGFRTGHRSFNIIGSYGTGKSSFIWALERNLSNQKTYFEPLNGQFHGLKKFQFVKLIGEAESFSSKLAETLNLHPAAEIKEIFHALDKLYNEIENENEVLVIVADEFGKFLEFAAKNNPDKELYLIQQLAEYVNDTSKNILFIVTLHQNFGAYARNLTEDQRQEWVKVKGRLVDIAFDEPIEQLLYLSAARIKEFEIRPTDVQALHRLIDTINKSKLTSNSENIDKNLAENLYPLDYLSANILTQALQRYGQNERSLFTFLTSEEPDSIKHYSPVSNESYNVAHVFDYLVNYMSEELENRDTNPHKASWRNIFRALEKAEALLPDKYKDSAKLIKTIGLVNIFSKELGYLDDKILAEYAEYALNISSPTELINSLKSKAIIKYFRPRNKYHFLNGTDVDFEKEITEAASKIEEIVDVKSLLINHIDLPTIPAKRIQFAKGTPRFYKFSINTWEEIQQDKPLNPEGEIDGYVNILLSENKLFKDVKEFSKDYEEHIFVVLNNLSEIKSLLFEHAKIDFVRRKYADDQVAESILFEERAAIEKLITKILFEDIYNKNKATWINYGQEQGVNSYKDLNRLISVVAENVYYKTPVFRNELVNKEYLSTPISTARKSLINDLLNSLEKENLGYPEKKFPPQKTIYLDLLKSTGIHREEEQGYILTIPNKNQYGFKDLWNYSETFLNEAKSYKKRIIELYDGLSQKPFKLKRGLIDFWIPIFLIARKEDYALFHVNNGFIPYITAEIFDLIHKKPQDYLIKTYQVEGIKETLFKRYQNPENLENQRGKGSSFITIFGGFLNFYSQLPEYNKQTSKLPSAALNLRLAIEEAKDPETALFNDFPKALGYHDLNIRDSKDGLNSYMNELNQSVIDLRTAFDHLLDRLEQRILELNSISSNVFMVYKGVLQTRFKTVKPELLHKKQRIFYTRLMSETNDRDSFIQGLCDALIENRVKDLKDEEEILLMNRLEEIFGDLEKLADLHSLQVGREKDQILRMEILDAEGNKKIDHITLSSKNIAKIHSLEQKLSSILEDDKEITKAALYNILKSI